jgi:hypothetical protein
MTKQTIQASANHYMRSEILARLVPSNGIGAEIGVHKGEFIKPILEATKPAKLHLIDPWYLFGKEWPWASGNKSTATALCNIIHTFTKELSAQFIILHIGYDLDILPEFPDHYFDWVYVDTSHKYEHTKAELSLLKHKVKRDGIIVGDDWHEDPSNLHHGVYRAVTEFVVQEEFKLLYASNLDKQWAIKQI